MSQVAVATSGLTKRFGHQVAVDSLDLVGHVAPPLEPCFAGWASTSLTDDDGAANPLSPPVGVSGRASAH